MGDEGHSIYYMLIILATATWWEEGRWLQEAGLGGRLGGRKKSFLAQRLESLLEMT